MNRKGLFIVIEGLDGTGKTTLAKGLVDIMNKNRPDSAVYLRAPGSTDYAEAVRSILMQNGEVSKQVQMLAMLSTLVDLTQREITPRLKQGIHVVCDRYLPSTLAYNTTPEDYESISLLRNISASSFMEKPHYVWLRSSIARVAERILARKEELTVFETGGDSPLYDNVIRQMARIVAGYHAAFSRHIQAKSIDSYHVDDRFVEPDELYNHILEHICP